MERRRIKRYNRYLEPGAGIPISASTWYAFKKRLREAPGAANASNNPPRGDAVRAARRRSPDRGIAERRRINTPDREVRDAPREGRVPPRRHFDENTPRVHLCGDLHVNEDVWELMLRKSDARFVKDVAILVWGERTLKQRCLDAKRANKYVDEDKHRKVVTPEKYEIVKDCLHYKLTKSGVDRMKTRKRMGKVWQHMSRAIYSLRRSAEPE